MNSGNRYEKTDKVKIEFVISLIKNRMGSNASERGNGF